MDKFQVKNRIYCEISKRKIIKLTRGLIASEWIVKGGELVTYLLGLIGAFSVPY